MFRSPRPSQSKYVDRSGWFRMMTHSRSVECIRAIALLHIKLAIVQGKYGLVEKLCSSVKNSRFPLSKMRDEALRRREQLYRLSSTSAHDFPIMNAQLTVANHAFYCHT